MMSYSNVNPTKLHNELIARGIFPISVESAGNDTFIRFSEGTDMQLVQSVIDAHDPTPLPAPKSKEEIIKEEIATMQGAIDFVIMNY